MLQKTKAGHKYEDHWLGPYKITYINADKGGEKYTLRGNVTIVFLKRS